MAALQDYSERRKFDGTHWFDDDNPILKAFDARATKEAKAAMRGARDSISESVLNLAGDIVSALVEELPLTPAEFAGLKAGTHRVVALDC